MKKTMTNLARFIKKHMFAFFAVILLIAAGCTVWILISAKEITKPVSSKTPTKTTALPTTSTSSPKETEMLVSTVSTTPTETQIIPTDETITPETEPTEATLPDETIAPTKPAETENPQTTPSKPAGTGSTQNTVSKPTYNNPPLDPSITFEDYNIWIDGKGYVTLAEAYAAGKARIKVINGVAYMIKTLNGVDYIKRADPDTGISYDGESPIIYTYADGTTGTEKQEGATYEELPGVYKTFAYSYDSVGRIIGSTCETCGLEVGGWCQAGYCLQWWFLRYCTCCGQMVVSYTCHHCPEPEYVIVYCQRCGKKYGDGTNNTCIGWLVDKNCPICDAFVPAHTCHTCEEPEE